MVLPMMAGGAGEFAGGGGAGWFGAGMMIDTSADLLPGRRVIGRWGVTVAGCCAWPGSRKIRPDLELSSRICAGGGELLISAGWAGGSVRESKAPAR